MSDILLKKVRTSQPQTAVGIDWSNPITRGLVVAALPTPKGYFNAANGQLIPCPTATNRFNGGGTAKSHVGGNGTTFANTGIPLTTEHTWLTLGVFASSNNATGGVTVSTSTVSVDNWYSVKNSTLWQGDYINSLGAVPLDTPVAVVGTQNSALTVTGYVKGKLSGTHSSGIAAQGSWVIGGYSHATVYTPWVGGCSLAIIFNRVLSSSEIKSISDNPWQVFALEERVITFDSLVSGGGTVDLVGANSTQGNTSSNGIITQNHTLLADNSSQTNQTTSGSLAQDVTLIGQSSVQGNTSSSVAFTQIHSLVSQPVSQSNSTTSESLTQNHLLVIQSVSQSNSTTNGTLTQLHSFVAQAVSQANSTTNGIIPAPGVVNLIADNSAQANTTSNGTLTQVHKLTAQVVTQTNSVTNGTLAQIHNLIANSAIQVNLSTTGSLSGAYNLSAQNCVQTNQTTSGNLSASISLVSANTTQSNTSESGIISQTHILIGRSVVQSRRVSTGTLPSNQKPVAWFAPPPPPKEIDPETGLPVVVVVPPPVLPAQLLANPRLLSQPIENRKIQIEVQSTRFKI